MKILIIGSEGFIGRNCKKYFSERNHAVYGCDIVRHSEENYFSVHPEILDYAPPFHEIVPDACINASGSANVSFSLQYPEKDFELNVKNVEQILEAIKEYSPECKFINFSSAAVYGNPKSLPVSEPADTNPLSRYGKHKLQSELLLQEYHNKYKLFTCSLRVFSVYGPGLRKQLFWDIYQKSLLKNEITLFGTGNESRDFIYIDDLLHAIEIIFQKGKFCGEAINVSSGSETKIKDAAKVFLSCFGNDFILQFSGQERKGDPKNWKGDISVLKQMGFTPFTTFEEGIKKYAAWLKKSESE